MQIFFKRQGQPRWKLKGISFAVKDMSTYSLCMCVCVCVCMRDRERKDERCTSRRVLLCMVMIEEAMA